MTAETFTCVPRYISAFPDNTPLTNALTGAEALGMDLLPQTELIAKVMEAKKENGRPSYPNIVLQIPRRSSKTTSVQQILLGRAFNIPGYRIVSTAQTQAIARRVFLEMVRTLEAKYPDPDNRPFVVRVGNGQEEIRWHNGSVWWIVAPRASAFRSQAADAIWLDEGGEYTPEQTDDLIQGVLPLMDTRPQGQIIVSGTPALVRDGMLWSFLTAARAGKPRYGIVDFSMDPTDDPTNEAVWWKVHAGLGSGLTDIEIIRERFEDPKMTLIQFQREYLCSDPVSASLRAIPEDDWQETQVADLLELPQENFAISYDVTQDGTAGAVAIAWYTQDGLPHVQILEHKAGMNWLPQFIGKLLTDHRGVEIGYDAIGNNLAVNQTIQRFPRVPKAGLRAMMMKEVAAGVSMFMDHVTDRSLVHAEDASLDAAVDEVSFRYSGDSRLWNRGKSHADISPLVAASNALYIAAGKRHKQAHTKRAPRTF